MDNEELNKRVNEVFDLKEGEYCQEVFTYNDELHVILVDKDNIPWAYVPDMSERPQAMAYILGQRDDFND